MDMPLEEQEALVGRTKEQAREGYCRGYAQAQEQKYGRTLDEYEIGAMMDRFEEYWKRLVLEASVNRTMKRGKDGF